MKVFKFVTTFLCTCAVMLFIVLCMLIYGSTTSDQKDTPKTELSQQQTETSQTSNAKSNLYKGEWQQSDIYDIIFEEINKTTKIGNYIAKDGYYFLELIIGYKNTTDHTVYLDENSITLIANEYEIKKDDKALTESQNQDISGSVNAGNKKRGYYYYLISDNTNNIKIEFKHNGYTCMLNWNLPLDYETPVIAPMKDTNGNEYLFDGLNNLIRFNGQVGNEYFYNATLNQYINEKGESINTDNLITNDGLYIISNGRLVKANN